MLWSILIVNFEHEFNPRRIKNIDSELMVKIYDVTSLLSHEIKAY